MKRAKGPGFILAATLVAGIARSEVVVLDDGDPGYSTTGEWTREESAFTWNTDEWWQSTPNNGATATWAFTNLAAGKYYLSASWRAEGNRTTAAQYAVDGTPAAVVDQSSAQSFGFDEEVFSAGYARLSSFNGYVARSISNGSLQVTVSSAVPGLYLMADSVRLERAPQDVEKVYVVDNEDTTGYTETGTWSTWEADPYDHRNNIRYTSDPTATATFNFTGLDDGVYRVSATWTPGETRPDDATYSIPEVGNRTVNQQVAPSDDVFEEVPWKHLFYGVTITNGILSVVLTNPAGGIGGVLIADAVRLEKLDMAYKSRFTLIEDFESHTLGSAPSSTNGWVGHGAANGVIVSNGNGQAAQLLSSGNAGYTLDLKANSIPDGGKGTVFFRTRSYGAIYNFAAYITDWSWDSGAWWEHDQAGIFGRFDTGDGTALRPHWNYGNIQDIQSDTWHNVWIVVDNAAKTFDLYLSRKDDRATGGVTSVTVATGEAFRSNTANELRTFMFLGTSDPDGGLIDDLYVAQGINLQIPDPVAKAARLKGTLICIF